MNTSSSRKLTEDFECSLGLADKDCSAHKKEWSQTDTHVTCWKCGLNLFPLNDSDETIEVLPDDADSDDDESDYKDEVTVAQAEVQTTRTPEESRSIRAMEGLDEIKNKCRISPIKEVQNFGSWVQSNRFELQTFYNILQGNKRFFPGTAVPMERRMFIVCNAYARYIDDLNIPQSVYDVFSFDSSRIDKQADRAFEEYTGRDQPRIILWIQIYARKMGYGPDVVSMALEMWDAADPVYVAAQDQVRAVVWLELTKKKMTGERFTFSGLSKKTGFDSRVISRVVKAYSPYFD